MSKYNTIVIEDVEQAEEVAFAIKKGYAGPVGFDTETEVKNGRRCSKISTIQVYVPWHHKRAECIIFHLALMGVNTKEDFPVSLRQIITAKHILKATVAPENDARWIASDFGFTMAGYLDVQTFAALQGHQKLGLDNLAAELIPGWDSKNKDMRFTLWNSKLTPEMINYAANDAYASCELLRIFMPTLFVIPEEYFDMNSIIESVNLALAALEEERNYRKILQTCYNVVKVHIKSPSACSLVSTQLAVKFSNPPIDIKYDGKRSFSPHPQIVV